MQQPHLQQAPYQANSFAQCVSSPAELVTHSPTGSVAGCCGEMRASPPSESIFVRPPRRKAAVRRVYVIVNPFGGKGRGRIVLCAALEEFGRRGVEATVLETKHRRHAEEYAKSIPLAGFDALCAIGGDGTFNEVLNGLLTRGDKQRIPLGLIASGTGNSTMVDLKCVDTHQCVAAICSGVVRAMDVIQASFENPDGSPGAPPAFKSFDSPATRYWINAVGFGLGVSAAMTAEHLRCLGQLRYDVGAFINIAKGFNNPAEVMLDGTRIDEDLAILVASNGERHAGMYVCLYLSLSRSLALLLSLCLPPSLPLSLSTLARCWHASARSDR